MSRPRIAILGAGPAGLGAAWQLSHRQGGSMSYSARSRRDAGSSSRGLCGHGVRLHPSATEVLSNLGDLLKDALLDRPSTVEFVCRALDSLSLSPRLVMICLFLSVRHNIEFQTPHFSGKTVMESTWRLRDGSQAGLEHDLRELLLSSA